MCPPQSMDHILKHLMEAYIVNDLNSMYKIENYT